MNKQTPEEQLQNRFDRLCIKHGVEELTMEEQMYLESVTNTIAQHRRQARRKALQRIKNSVSSAMYSLVRDEVQTTVKLNHIKRDLVSQGASLEAMAQIENSIRG